MKLVNILKGDIQKVKAWINSKEPQFISDIQQVAAFTEEALAWVKSPQGQSAEAFVNAYVEKAPKWEGTATTIATALLTDMQAITSPAALEGIALRLGAEVLQILDGAKLPTGIAGYIAEFQTIFIG